MLPKYHAEPPSHLFNRASQDLQTFGDLLPCAVALWSPDRSYCVPNYRACQLTGLNSNALRKDPSLWMRRIHPEDRGLYSDAWKRLTEGEKTLSSDYRFCPSGGGKVIWLREMSASHQNSLGQVEGVSSAYMDISNLKAPLAKNREQQNPALVNCPLSCLPVFDGLIHEIQNELQVLENSLYFSSQSLPDSPDYRILVERIERVGKAMSEFRQFLALAEPRFSKANFGVILQGALQAVKKKAQGEGIRLQVRSASRLPPVRVDVRQLRDAINRLLEFSRTLLPHGGEVEIETNLEKIDDKQFVKLELVASSPFPLQVEEKDVFEPFLRVNNQKVGLSMVVAEQILRQHHAYVSFRKQNPNQAQFTVLLEVY